MRRYAISCLSVLVVASALVACSKHHSRGSRGSSTVHPPSDQGSASGAPSAGIAGAQNGGAGGRTDAGKAAPPGIAGMPAPALTCNGVLCPPAPMGSTLCCTNGGTCGTQRSPFASCVQSGFTVPPPDQPVTCTSRKCPAVGELEAAQGIAACCTDDGACGLHMPRLGGCVASDSPGSFDATCPTWDAGDSTWYGCCAPSGRCGLLVGDGVGCFVPPAGPSTTCTANPINRCERVIEVVCDGAEDCAGGYQCCALHEGGYRRFVCGTDCAALARPEAPGRVWSEACHPGDACSAAGFSCRSDDALPDYLSRCAAAGAPASGIGLDNAAGEINCGASICGREQKCCISVPGSARCVPREEPCSCDAGDVDIDAGS